MPTVLDGFGRANATLTGSSTESGGLTWLAPASGAPAAQIISNQVAPTGAGNSFSVVDLGSASGTVRATAGTADNWAALYACESAAGYYRVEWGSNFLYLTRDGSTALANVGALQGVGKVLSMTTRVVGATVEIDIAVDGLIVLSYVDSTASRRTGTRFGVGASGNASARMDDFVATTNPQVLVLEYQSTLPGTASPVTAATFAKTPGSGDIVVLVVDSWISDENWVATGMGATWARYNGSEDSSKNNGSRSGQPQQHVFIGRGATTSGAVTLTLASGTLRGTVHGFILRGDGSMISVLPRQIQNLVAGTTATVTAARARTGDMVIGTIDAAAGTGVPTLAATPAFTTTKTSGGGSFAESAAGWRQVTGAAEDVVLNATMGAALKNSITALTVTCDPQPLPAPEVFLYSSTYVDGTATFTVPMRAMEFLPGDVAVMIESHYNGASGATDQIPDYTPSGLGGTWTEYQGVSGQNGPRIDVWVGRGLTTPGDVTLTKGAIATRGLVQVFLIRGLATTTFSGKAETYTNVAATSLTGPITAAKAGELVVAAWLGTSTTGTRTMPSPEVPSGGWRTMMLQGGVYGYGSMATRVVTADADHQASVAASASQQLAVTIMRFGEVVAPQSGAIGRATETDTAGTVRNGPPGTLYEDAPFPGLNRDADHRVWFVDGQPGVTPTYGTTVDGVLEWTWPFAYNPGWQLVTRRIGNVETSAERYSYVEWHVDAQPGVTPEMRMRAASGSPRYAVLAEDLGGGWWRTWVDWNGYSGYFSMNDPIGPTFEWAGIAPGGKVKVRRFATSRTLGDTYAEFKILRATETADVWTINGVQGPPPVFQPIDRAAEADSAADVAPSQTLNLTGPIARATEDDAAQAVAPPLDGPIGRATEDDAAQAIATPLYGDIGRATETGTVFDVAPRGDVDPPPHDVLADALVLAGDYGSETMTLTGSTIDPGETVPTGVVGTVWAQWTAEETTTVTFTVDAASDSVIWVTAYGGDPVAQIEQASGAGTATVTFDVTAGQTYWLQVGDGDGTFEIRWAAAPVIVPPAEPYEYARVEVYDPTGDTLLSEIPKRSALNWQEPVNESGAGQMTVRLDDPVLKSYADAGTDLLDWGNVVKVWLGDTCVHGFRIKRRRLTLVDGGEHTVAWAREVSGPSVQHLMDDFIVRHWPVTRDRSLESRSFMWHAPESAWYDPDDWQPEYNASAQDDPPGDFDLPAADRAKYKEPKKFPDAAAKWMWVSPDPARNEGAFDPPGPMNGMRYWRKTFTTTEKQVVRLYASADETYRVYLDGEEVLSGDGEETGYTEIQRRKIKLHAGEHTIAIWTQSGGDEPDSDGADAVLFTMMRLNAKGKPVETIVRSNDTWLTTYVRPVPSWNRAQVLRKVIIEAQDRGVQSAQALTLGFTGATDTAGKPWLDRFNRDVEVGTTVLALQAMLSEDRGFDVWVDPATLTVRAWRRRGSDKSASVTLEPGRNLLSWSIEESDEAKTAYLIHYDGGWADWVAPAASKRLGLRETFVTLGKHTDDDEAIRVIRKAAKGIAWAEKKAGTSDLRKRPDDAPAGALIAVDGARPFLDFGPGDIVKAPNEWGVLVPHRVMMLSATEDDGGGLSYDPVLEEV